jgi:release factor glutamine methyltransferase
VNATVKDLIAEGVAALEGTSSSPRLDTELLLAATLSRSRALLLAYSAEVVGEENAALFRTLIRRRALHEPVAYLLGEQEFWSLRFRVTPATLIPRPETEQLVELAIQRFPTSGQILDLGTGSGCVVIALATEAKKRGLDLSFVAVDQSAEALSVAEFNANRHAVADRITFMCGSWCAPLRSNPKKYGLVVSNPPYIRAGDPECSPETRFEPENALFAGADGLDDLRQLLREVPVVLDAHGRFLSEIGVTQGEAAGALPAEGLRFLGVHNDLTGRGRVAEWGRLP